MDDRQSARSGDGRVDVVVVGQTPPPHHGQAIMIERLLRGRFERVRLHHVRMAFSREIGEVGRPGVRKVAHLAEVIARAAGVRARTGARVLYYPPAFARRAPLYRDVALLLALRPLFAHTLFHFHAGGLEAALRRMTGPERRLAARAFAHPTGAIRLAALAPPDDRWVQARHSWVIPYGIEDHAPAYPRAAGGSRDGPPVILSVGMLHESKGVLTILAACARLKQAGQAFRLRMAGAFSSAAFEARVRAFIADRALQDHVELLGVVTGEAKWRAFSAADLFVFPTYYELETFGLVVLEAMQFSLPVVASRFRSLPELVVDGETGVLVEPRADEAWAAVLSALLSDPERRRRMGQAGRERYLAHYTLDRFHREMERAMLEVAETREAPVRRGNLIDSQT